MHVNLPYLKIYVIRPEAKEEEEEAENQTCITLQYIKRRILSSNNSRELSLLEKGQGRRGLLRNSSQTLYLVSIPLPQAYIFFEFLIVFTIYLWFYISYPDKYFHHFFGGGWQVKMWM